METFILCFLLICGTLVSCPSTQGITASVDVSAKNDDYSKECMEKLKLQIQREVEASLKYLVMGAYFNRDSVNRLGFAKFFFESANEERSHAKTMMSYLNMRGDAIDKFHDNVNFTHLEWTSGKAALEEALQMEKGVTKHIKEIIIFCMSDEANNEDHLADYLINDFMTEQLEGQRQLAGFISKIDRMGDGQEQLKEFLFDQTLLNEGSAHSK